MSLSDYVSTAISTHATRSAVITETATYTYKQLSDFVDSFRLNKICPTTDVVGIYAEDGWWLVSGMVSCWALGIPFVCMDKKWPGHRVDAVIKGCGVTVLVHEGGGVKRVGDGGGGSRDVAYFTCTSGTTGVAKIVATSESGLLEASRGKIEVEKIQVDSVLLLASAATFDPCQIDTASAILSNAAISAPTRQTLTSWRLSSAVSTATHICCTPTHFNLLTDLPTTYPNLQCVTLGGEPFPRSIQTSPWCHSHIIFRNTYGLTEGTGYQTSAVITSGMSRAPIGSGFGSYKVSLSDDGEIVITGPGLSRYHGEVQSEVLRTGDYGEMTPEGLVVVGRRDGRVKINGQRLSLEDVDAVLQSTGFLSAATSCIVDGQLGAHITPSPHIPLTPTEFATASESYCARRLPLYSIPRLYATGPPLPQGSGKSNRAPYIPLVREQHATRLSSLTIESPSTPLETIVLEAVSHALATPFDKLGTTHNFTHLGGDSLSALRVVNYIRTRTTLADPEKFPPVTAFAGVASMLVLPEQPEGSVCQLADVMGPYAPCELIARPVLGVYAAYLAESGVVAEGSHEVQAAPQVQTEEAVLLLQCARRGVSDVLAAFCKVAELDPVPAWGLLHEAVAYGQKEAAELLAKGKPTCYLSTAAHVAAARGRADILQYLLSEGADAEVLDVDGQSVVHLAARSGDVETVRLAVQSAESLVEVADSEGVTPLQWAVRNNNQEVVSVLEEAKPEESFGRVKRRGPREGAVKIAHRKVKKNDEVIDGLMDRVRAGGSEEDMLEAVTVIRSMVCAVKSHRMAFVERGLVGVLNSFLWPPGSLSAQAAGTLRNLSSDQPTRLRMIAEGSIPPLVRLLDLGPTSESCWRAAAALGGLSTSKEAWGELLATGAAKVITDMGARKLGLPEGLVEQL